MINLIYQVWPISWREPQFKGDKRSALKRITDFLPRVKKLGAKYIWISPVYPSPWHDHGYDVADYCDIDPRLGNIDEFKQLVKIAKEEYGIGILMDLVLNHTSTEHKWFKNHPEYYCWSDKNKKRWKNLFDNSSAWKFDSKRGKFFLHLFHETQADLNWFNGPARIPNPKLIKEFQNIVDFWTNLGVAGFRLDAFQVINKDVKKEYFDPFETATTYIDLAAKVLNRIFDETRSKLYLLGECLDLSGEMVKFYHEHSPMSAIMDDTPIISLEATKDLHVKKDGLVKFFEAAKKAYEKCPEGYAHVTESHDSVRFTSAVNIDPITAIDILFGSAPGNGILDNEHFFSPQTIVMYQGQELGLRNPTKRQLSNEKMLDLDAQTKMRHKRGEALDELRKMSRSNTRVKIPMNEYSKQEKNDFSCLKYTRYICDLMSGK